MLGYKIFRTTLVTLVLLALIVGQITKARADTARRDPDDQRVLAKAQYLLKQVSTERDALKADNAQLKTQLDAANARLTTQQKTSGEAIAKYRENTSSLGDHLREMTEKNQQLSADFLAAKNEGMERTQQVRVCADNNLKIYQISMELANRYRKKGVFDALLQREPVTQLKRVEIDNIAEQYKDLLGDLKFQVPREIAAH